MVEQNPPSPSLIQEPPSEDAIPDHCRPLSPERDGLDGSENPSPGVPEVSAEAQTNGNLTREDRAFTEAEQETSCAPAPLGNDHTDTEQQYTSGSPSNLT